MPDYLVLFTKELFGYIDRYGLTAAVIGLLAGSGYVLTAVWRASVCGAEKVRRDLFIRGILTAMFVMYLVMFLGITIFSRTPGSITEVNLKPFDTFRYKRFTVENVMLFVPWGFFYHFFVPVKLRRFYAAGMAGMLVSVGTETVQYMTQRGGAELDDVLTNTAGMLCGYALAALIRYAWTEKTD